MPQRAVIAPAANIDVFHGVFVFFAMYILHKQVLILYFEHMGLLRKTEKRCLTTYSFYLVVPPTTIWQSKPLDPEFEYFHVDTAARQ